MSLCAHEYVKVRRWPAPRHLRYRCRLCGDTTRRYDGVDQMGTRPVHRHMTVAFPPLNVVRRDGTMPPTPRRVLEFEALVAQMRLTHPATGATAP